MIKCAKCNGTLWDYDYDGFGEIPDDLMAKCVNCGHEISAKDVEEATPRTAICSVCVKDTPKPGAAMTYKMTIDDLLEWIGRKSHEHDGPEFDDVIAYITDNRPALEAGMRVVLRFKIINENEASLIGIDGTKVTIPSLISIEDIPQTAQSLGLTAEFVD